MEEEKEWAAAYIVLFSEFFGEGSAHDHAADGGWGAEMGFAGLAPRGREGWKEWKGLISEWLLKSGDVRDEGLLLTCIYLRHDGRCD